MSTDQLAKLFSYKAEWRRDKSLEYPDDKRNIEAAECLDQLAATVGDIRPKLMLDYNALSGVFFDMELHTDLLSQVGFHWHPANASEFLRNLSNAQCRVIVWRVGMRLIRSSESTVLLHEFSPPLRAHYSAWELVLGCAV